jgi:hypothetical protein
MGLPAWRWVALVEGWARSVTDPEKHDELEADLSRQVHFQWATKRSDGEWIDVRRPDSWQKNQKGESLLSAKRKRAPKADV